MLLDEGRKIWADFKRIHVGTHASSISFFFFMSIIPVIIVYACLLPGAGIQEQDLIEFFRGLVPETLGDFAASLVTEAYEKSGLALSLSILTLLWTASQGASALRGGLNAVYGIEENRNRLLVGGISIASLAILLAVLSAVIYLVLGGTAMHVLASIAPELREQSAAVAWLQSFAMLLIGVFVFAACYTYLAAGKRGFRAQLPGAAFAAVAWFLFSFGFHVYIDHFNRFALFYGSLGTVALFLFWMYCIFYILLVGGCINRYHAGRKDARAWRNA